MSWSNFADRFRTRVAMPLLDYVTRWRLYQVRRALIETDRPLARIATDNGYQSRTSCDQSFRRLYGCSPGELRDHTVTRVQLLEVGSQYRTQPAHEVLKVVR